MDVLVGQAARKSALDEKQSLYTGKCGVDKGSCAPPEK